MRTVAESLGAVRRFPIMHGPNVPWEVMEPHEAQAQRNHSQSLQRLAERGGLSPAEAWLVVHDQQWPPGWTKELADEWTLLWGRYAAEVNQRYERQALRITELEVRNADLRERLIEADRARDGDEQRAAMLERVVEAARSYADVASHAGAEPWALRTAINAADALRLTETASTSKGEVNVTDSRPVLTPTGEPCLDCGKAVVWYADAESGESLDRIELWMRVSDNNAVYFLCPTCFILRAEVKGISEIWRLTPTLGTALKGKRA